MGEEWLWIGWEQYFRRFRWLFISLFRQSAKTPGAPKQDGLPSKNSQALRSLTSVIGREPVHSTRYGRSHWHLKQNWFCFWEHSFIQYCFTHLAIFFHFFLQMHFNDDSTEKHLIRFRSIGQQATSVVWFQIKLINSVGILTSSLSLTQQLGL